jgi:chitodextrinase
LATLAVGTSAMAAKPPPPGAKLTLSPTEGSTGTSVTATGANFDNKATATLTFGTTNVGSAKTSASGAFTKSFAVPSGYSGATTVTARTTAKTATASFNVTSPPPDTTAPSAPSNLAASPGDAQLSLSWGASTDNVGVTGYRIIRNGTQVATVGGSTLSYTDTGLVNGAIYSYTARAVDAAGNVSSDSNTATATPQASPDIIPPAAPTGLTATAGDAQVELDWADNSESDLDHYNVYRDGTQVASPSASNFTDPALTNGTSYSYQVTAVDHSGNESAKSSSVSAIPQAAPDTTAPAAPTGLTATAGDSQVSLDWADSPESDFSHYNVYRNGVKVASPSGSAHTDTGLTNGTTYDYYVTAVDTSGNESAKSASVSATPQASADIMPPAAPTGLTATAGDAQVSLDWADNPSGDGVDHYNVYRNDTKVASPTTSAYTDTGLTNETQYTYQVTAVDVAGNESAKSSSVSATPQQPADTTPPPVPTGLTATPGDKQVALDWADSSASDFNHFVVYRDSTDIAHPTSSNYTDTGLTNGTQYTYQVSAVDNAGNESAKSSAVSATPQAPSGNDPVITAAGDLCGSSTDCVPSGQLVQSIAPDKALTLGDNAYPDGTLSNFNSFYQPGWGPFKANTHPVPGNHDYHVSGAADYFSYFGQVAAPGPYYGFDLGNWHLIALASSSGVSPSAGGAEETWLKNDLAQNTKPCTLAYWHEPRFSSGTVHGNNSSWNAIWNDLYNAGVEVILNGHEHNYERFAPQNPNAQPDATRGIMEVVAGTGGEGGSYPFGTIQANSVKRFGSNTFGVVKMTLHPNGYDFQFVPDSRNPSATDSTSGTCH